MSGLTAAVAIGAAALFLVLGVRYPRVRQPLMRSGFHADLVHAAVNGPLVDASIAYSLVFIGSPGLMRAEPLWLQATFLLIGGDLVKWTLHMLHHRVPILWRFHRLHHCTQQMDALSAVRLHPVEVFFSRTVFAALFISVAGVDPALLVTYSTLDAIQGLWIHSNTRVKTRWLNYILSTQEFHHWHHANDQRAVNRNFGGFLSIWDWIFGTAYCPRNEEPNSFGIAEMPTPPTRYLDQVWLPMAGGAVNGGHRVRKGHRVLKVHKVHRVLRVCGSRGAVRATRRAARRCRRAIANSASARSDDAPLFRHRQTTAMPTFAGD